MHITFILCRFPKFLEKLVYPFQGERCIQQVTAKTCKLSSILNSFIFDKNLTLNLLTTTIVAPPSNASKWQMGFKLAFKGLT